MDILVGNGTRATWNQLKLSLARHSCRQTLYQQARCSGPPIPGKHHNAAKVGEPDRQDQDIRATHLESMAPTMSSTSHSSGVRLTPFLAYSSASNSCIIAQQG